jgi:SAM-dependent methyltransferase
VALYAATIFLSAFLLFQVQPLIGKYILPWFGGGPTVWTTCMLFFQAALLAGYAYAHVIRTRLAPSTQALVHTGLLLAAALALPILPSATWKPEGGTDPTWRILVILAVSVGLPYLALAATSPLLQAWFSMTHPGVSPYRLYALSNAGSLLALASYPFAIEPLLRLKTQSYSWSAAFVAFAILCAVCAVRLRRAKLAAESVAPASDDAAEAPRPSPITMYLWVALAACGSVMLLAVTNQLSMDVAVVPFLWILPLSLYLLSFVLCFESDRIYWRPVFWPLMVVGAAGMVVLLFWGVYAPLKWQIIAYAGGLFACCMVCHGELARLKPNPRYLTSFYLMSSAGGALGGLAVTVVAPLVLKGYFELHVGLWLCFVLAILAFWHEMAPLRRRLGRWALALFCFASPALLAGLGVALGMHVSDELADSLALTRNFYGVLKVELCSAGGDDGEYYVLRHGRILHGSQFARGPLHNRPTEYYWEKTGIGLAIQNRRPGSPMRVGVVGLGTGTIAAYGRPGDTYRFYEINPEVEHLARTWFSYLGESGAACDVVLGDARLSLEREAPPDRQPPQQYDVIALDAFTSDAIPIHLLTREAFEAYQRHLKPDGVLAVHISNRFLDLQPVVLGLAEYFCLASAVIESTDENRTEYSAATWILVTRDTAFLESPAMKAATSEPESDAPSLRLWTDDYSDLFHILK